jgi:hypothetical protein
MPIEPLGIFSFDTTAQEDGDFKVCFNNHMSTWTQKTVWFQVWHITREDQKQEHGQIQKQKQVQKQEK